MKIERISRELNKLAKINFQNWNENDIREDFIKPLLNLLGYRKNTDYDINREGKHALHKPFLMVGRKRIDIDYELVIRKKNFWIIEAKPASPVCISEESIFQAHLYALHPEVNAQYFAVINGWEIVLYDSRNIDENYKPILRIKHLELPENFIYLNNLVGAKSIIPTLKKRVLEDIRDIFSVEVREENLQEFSQEVSSILEEARPSIWTNAKKVIDLKLSEYTKATFEYFSGESINDLIKIGFLFPSTINEFTLISDIFLYRFHEINNLDKTKILEEIIAVSKSKTTINHKINLVHLLIKLRKSDCSLDLSSLKNEIRLLIKLFLLHFEDDVSMQQLWQFEGILYRVFYKASFYLNSFFESLINGILGLKFEILDDEELIFQNPHITNERLELVDKIVHAAYFQYKDLDVSTISSMIEELERFEVEIDSRFQREVLKMSDQDKPILNYEFYNKPFDYMNSKLFCILSHEFASIADSINNELFELSNNLLRKESKDYQLNWVDVFIVKYLIYNKQYELIENITSSSLSEEQISKILETLTYSGNLFTYKPNTQTSESNLRVFHASVTIEGENWRAEGEFNLEKKKLLVALKKPSTSSFTRSPLQPRLDKLT